jgi:hypothetical protein
MKKIIKEVVSRNFINRLTKIENELAQILKIQKKLQKLGVKLIIRIDSGNS